MEKNLRSLVMVMTLMVFTVLSLGLLKSSFAEKEDIEKTTVKKEIKWEVPPQIRIDKWGSEIRIMVEPHLIMDRDKVKTIQLVKLEDEKGQFLGIKTFNPDEEKRRAEFLLNPEELKLEKVKVTVNSTVDGDWTKTVPLEVTTEDVAMLYTKEKKEGETEIAPEESATAPQAVVEEEKKEEGKKKKGWLW